jgi:Coenzyme PQQ synthesis protein D (PqqD)
MTPVPHLDVRIRNYRGTLILSRADTSLELTDVAALVWRLMDGSRSVDQIAEVIATEYAIDLQTATDDTSELVHTLVTGGMVELTD